MKKKMTFSRLVEKIAKETKTSKELIHNLLTETVALNQKELKETGHNSITGFGRFSLKWHKARKGRNPQSGETIDIAGHNTINFKPQAALRKHINRHYSRIKPELIEKEKKPTITKEIIPPDLKKEVPAIENKKEEIAQPIIEKPKTEPTITEKKQKETPKTNEGLRKEQRLEEKQKKPINRWIWPIILFLFIILFYIFWPSSDSSDNTVQDKPTTEEITVKEDPVNGTPIVEEKTIETPKKEIVKGIPASKYKLKNGDYLYRIAQNYYKAASLWPIIYKANKNLSPNPEIVIIGGDINLPALEGNLDKLTTQDKKNITEGYLEVYLYYKSIDHKKAIYHLWVAKKINMPEVLEAYTNRINQTDFETVNTIEGELKLEIKNQATK